MLRLCDDAEQALARAGYDGRAGHPVLLGRRPDREYAGESAGDDERVHWSHYGDDLADADPCDLAEPPAVEVLHGLHDVRPAARPHCHTL